ncbi:MAG: BatA domain-containing protein, partial [Lentisphaerota bacterium]
MSFINPLLLFGMLFLAVPLILQFFINRKKIILYWAAYEWIKKAHVVRRKNVKINELLKLIAKLLLIFFLVLFLSRPTASGGRGGSKMIIIDNTLRMATNIEDRTRLEFAKEIAGNLAAKSDSPVVICSFDGFLTAVAKIKEGRGMTAETLKGVELSPNSADMKDFSNALSASTDIKEVETVYFISDFQKCFFGDAKLAKEALARLGKGKKLVFIPVDTRGNLQNLGVESYSVATEGFFPGNENEITVKIKNHSSAPVTAVPVTLSIDGKKHDRAMISLKPKEEQDVKLNISISEAKEHKASVTIPPDCYALDNVLDFAINPGKQFNVLAVTKSKGDEQFEYDVFFQRVLKSFCSGEYLKYKRVGAAQLFEENLDNYDLVVTFGIPFTENSSGVNVIRNYLQKKKSLISFSDCDSNGYWKGLGIESGETQKEMAKPDMKRLKGTYLGFMEESELDPQSVNFFKYMPIKESGGIQEGGRLFLQDSADAVIVFREINGGKVLLAGFMPYPGYTDFFYNPNFVQFTMRMIWEMFPRKVFSSYIGKEIESISIDNADPDLKYTIVGDSGIIRKLELKGMGASTKLGTTQMTVNDFFSVLAGNENVSSLGYSTSRVDADIAPAVKSDFNDAVKHGLLFDEG